MPRRGRGTINTTAEGLTVYEKTLKAIELRKTGVPYRDIARVLGYSSASTVYEAVQKHLQKQVRENADELRELELERLDELYKQLMKTVLAGGRGAARAAEVAIKVLERRAKLLGLDEAERREITVEMPQVVEYFRDDNQDEHKRKVREIIEG